MMTTGKDISLNTELSEQATKVLENKYVQPMADIFKVLGDPTRI